MAVTAVIFQIRRAESLLDQMQLFAKWIRIARFLEQSLAVERLEGLVVNVLAYFAPLHWDEILDVFAGL